MSDSSIALASRFERIRDQVKRFFGPWGVFFKGFLKHPVMVGSIIPSSRWTVQKMLGPVKWDECKLFVEYGPGVGTFCQPVLDRMRKDATLLVIDTNPDFIDFLRKHFRDSRFIAVHGSAADVNEIIRERYSPSEWNIYGAQASDGDNWHHDSGRCRELLADKILPLCRYFAYVQVAEEEQNLWDEYSALAAESKAFAIRKVTEASQIYPVFRDLFKKEGAAA